MMKCPFCGSEIPANSKFCPECGKKLDNSPAHAAPSGVSTDAPQNAAPIPPQTTDAASAQNTDAASGQNASSHKKGHVFGRSNRKVHKASASGKKPHSKKKRIALISTLVVCALLVIGGVQSNIAYQEQKKAEEAEQAKQQYHDDMQKQAHYMLSECADAESCGNKIQKVWHNSIMKTHDAETDPFTLDDNGEFYSDFNDALKKLFSNQAFATRITTLQTHQMDITSHIKDLNNPPDEYKDAYSHLTDFYNSYSKFVDLVTSPSGTYQTFTRDFSTYDSDTSAQWTSMQIYL